MLVSRGPCGTRQWAFETGDKIDHVGCDLAFLCAMQNEFSREDAHRLGESRCVAGPSSSTRPVWRSTTRERGIEAIGVDPARVMLLLELGRDGGSVAELGGVQVPDLHGEASVALDDARSRPAKRPVGSTTRTFM
jgi:hypothetical protein